jgi:hypothetical protein
VIYVVVSSPPVTDETGAMVREIESRRGICRVVAFLLCFADACHFGGQTSLSFAAIAFIFTDFNEQKNEDQACLSPKVKFLEKGFF